MLGNVKVNWATVVAVLVVVSGLILAMRSGMTAPELVALAAAAMPVIAQFEKMFAPRDPGKPPTPPPPVGPMIFVACFAAAPLLACAAVQDRAAQAEAAYLAEQLRCVDVATTREESQACRRSVRERWGIAETVTARRDGGR